MLRRVPKIVLLPLAIALLLPVVASATIDTACSTTAGMSGYVKDPLGVPLPNLRVAVSPTNSTVEDASTSTGSLPTTGFYHLCAKNHGTLDVHVQDRNAKPLYADINQPYTTETNQGRADFTAQTGYPVLYKLSVTPSPVAVTTVTAPATITFTVKTKMPFANEAPISPTRSVTLKYVEVLNPSGASISVTMSPAGTTGGGPAGGGWNLWTGSVTFAKGYQDVAYYATAKGSDAGTTVTQSDTQPFFVDNKYPIFGSGPPLTTTSCNNGGHSAIYGFSPYYPTTNQQPIASHGVCDNGDFSGLDRYSPTLKVCPAQVEDSSCTTESVVLGSTAIVWVPQSPLSLGKHYLVWSIQDLAGNLSKSSWDLLEITTSCEAPAVCNKPKTYAPAPATFPTGDKAGIVQGCSACTPTSVPKIAFKIQDPDGMYDIREIVLKIYYQDESQLVYVYDRNLLPTTQPTLTDKRGGGTLQPQSDGLSYQLIADGYPLVGKPSGRYIVSAAAYDNGGNASELTWEFILVTAP
ncbi:MAG: hypothetical protein ABR548_05825 [Actinomycetota bacterium]|nr:hypothetical protein [Actinomycetota bacterium]